MKYWKSPKAGEWSTLEQLAATGPFEGGIKGSANDRSSPDLLLSSDCRDAELVLPLKRRTGRSIWFWAMPRTSLRCLTRRDGSRGAYGSEKALDSGGRQDRSEHRSGGDQRHSGLSSTSPKSTSGGGTASEPSLRKVREPQGERVIKFDSESLW